MIKDMKVITKRVFFKLFNDSWILHYVFHRESAAQLRESEK